MLQLKQEASEELSWKPEAHWTQVMLRQRAQLGTEEGQVPAHWSSMRVKPERQAWQVWFWQTEQLPTKQAVQGLSPSEVVPSGQAAQVSLASWKSTEQVRQLPLVGVQVRQRSQGAQVPLPEGLKVSGGQAEQSWSSTW
jgi:hypothetical protein